MILVFLSGGLFLGGLAHYAHVVTTPTPKIDRVVDGIVVLTGGENRIKKASNLLAEGKSERLLITGVNPQLSDATLQKLVGLNNELYDCCVTIDRAAKNTIGNALAAEQWARSINAKSLIIVTGAFHMPRAISELSHTLNAVDLIASPVNVPTEQNWFIDPSRVRDMLREYSKLTVVKGRDLINEAFNWPWPTMLGYDALSEAQNKSMLTDKGLERKTLNR